MNEIFQRTSIRRFHPRPVETGKITLLLRAAMAAPSAGNQQPWEFYTVTQKETLEKLSACSPYAACLGMAPLKERMEKARQILCLPEHLEAFAFIACGYPAEKKLPQDRYNPERIHRIS